MALTDMLRLAATSRSAPRDDKYFLARLLALLDDVQPTAGREIFSTCVVRPLTTAAVNMILAMPGSPVGADLLAALLRQDYLPGNYASSPAGRLRTLMFVKSSGQRQKNPHVIFRWHS